MNMRMLEISSGCGSGGGQHSPSMAGVTVTDGGRVLGSLGSSPAVAGLLGGGLALGKLPHMSPLHLCELERVSNLLHIVLVPS